MKRPTLAALLLAGMIASPAIGQMRVQAPQPPASPGFQAPQIDAMMLRLNAMQAQLDALRESAGKQVVVLHFTDGQSTGYSDSEPAKDTLRAADLCKSALGDRYGRMIWYHTDAGNDGIYFDHVVCETKP